MRPWIAVAYSAPVAAATAVFIIYPIGQGSFSDGMPLGKLIAPPFLFLAQNSSNKTKIFFYFFLFFSHICFKEKYFKTFSWGFLYKKRLETCLNGANLTFQILGCLINFEKEKDNSVPSRIGSRKQSGIYSIRCVKNNKRYYGESKNISGRLASHKSMLNRGIHPNFVLQYDWNRYGFSSFEFQVLFMGDQWSASSIRRAKETELIILNRSLTYNILESHSNPGGLNPFWKKTHTPETKKKISDALKNKPNDLLGRRVSIKGIIYPSIAEASRQTGVARKTIRKKIDLKLDTNYFEIKESATV